MSVRHALLALLSEGPKYGMRLRQEFEAGTGEVWPLNVGQVYMTLQRLERDGLVASDGEGAAGPQRTYRLTGEGRAELRSWLGPPPDSDVPPRDELVIKVLVAMRVPGVDVLWVGHFDLSASLGIPGEFGHPRVRAATARIVAAARARGLGLGRLVTGAEEAALAWRDGFRMLAWGGDAWLLQQAVAEGVAGLRRMAAAGPKPEE